MKLGLIALVGLMACSASNTQVSAAIADRSTKQFACIVDNDATAPALTCYLAAQAAFCAKYPSDPTCTDGGVNE